MPTYHVVIEIVAESEDEAKTCIQDALNGEFDPWACPEIVEVKLVDDEKGD